MSWCDQNFGRSVSRSIAQTVSKILSFSVCATFGFLLASFPLAIGDEENTHFQGEERSAVGARVIMERTEIHGKVIFVGEDRDSEEVAAGVRIRILPEDGGKVIHEAQADSTGFFKVPPLNVGNYLMSVGRLWIKLNVIPINGTRGEIKEKPKILLVFIPRNLG